MAYNYGSSESTEDWPNTTPALIALFSDDNGLIPLIPEFGCGTDGDNTFSLFINTTSSTDDGSFSRGSAWRKAYRFLNRFDTVNISMDRFGSPDDGSATYNAKRSFFGTTTNYETPFDHKPPCRFPFFPSSNQTMDDGETSPLIELVYSMALNNIDIAADDWDGQLSDQGVQWAIGAKGLGLIQNTTPDAMEFPIRMQDGKVDTARSVIPAYSGEILSFQPNLDPAASDNLGFGYMGNTVNGSIIYIDITQTDEVLRWNPDPDGADAGIKPEEWWVKTISGIQVKNSDNPKSGFVNFKKGTMAVVSDDKNNYIVSFTSPKELPLNSWGTGQNIRVLLKRKKIIRLSNTDKPWEGAEYENIRYRRLEDEFRDDVFFQVSTDPPVQTGACCTNGVCEQKTLEECQQGGGQFFGVGSETCTDCVDDSDDSGDGGQQSTNILPFTTTLNGTLENGTITINYPAPFEATDVTFEVFIEKDQDQS